MRQTSRESELTENYRILSWNKLQLTQQRSLASMAPLEEGEEEDLAPNH